MGDNNLILYWFCFYVIFQIFFTMLYLEKCSANNKAQLREDYGREKTEGLMGSEWLLKSDEVYMSFIIPLVVSILFAGIIRIFM